VVGIDSSLTEPRIWSDGPGAAGSNTHPRFEIAAPAIGILSTVAGHKFVTKTGTSFAAPQVTAAASLLFARAESFWADDPDVIPPGSQIPPKVVKDRLVYTADYFPSLKGKVLGGRLNVSRALAVEQAQFKLFGRDETIMGIVTEAPQFIQCNQGDGAE
jgi:subtilisin family serine protease